MFSLMAAFSSLARRARDALLLESRAKLVAARSPTQRETIAGRHRAARKRVRSARELMGASSDAAAFGLYRDAATMFIGAMLLSKDATFDVSALTGARAWYELESHTDDLPLAPPPPELDAVREAMRSTNLLVVDDLEPAQLAALRVGAERVIFWLDRQVEPRSVRQLKWARALRVAMLFGTLVGVIVASVLLVRRPRNVALRKPVIVSSRFPDTTAPSALVDGERNGRYGVHTKSEDAPSVTIDLLGTYDIEEIRVFNRTDGWYDESLPLVLELGDEQGVYTRLARKADHFDVSTPWKVTSKGKKARTVRIRSDRRTHLCLGEVEVYGRK